MHHEIELKGGAKLVVDLIDTTEGGQRIACQLQFADGSLGRSMLHAEVDANGQPTGAPSEWTTTGQTWDGRISQS